MRLFIRLFFRLIRLVLTPFMLLAEWLTTPKAINRSAEQQAQVNQACQQLALYQFAACPFCIKVRKEMARLGLTIEKRDAQHNPLHRKTLHDNGGKIKVPCLRITSVVTEAQPKGQAAAQQEQWLYESTAIIHYLQQQFTTEPVSQ
ncbi:glutaredoxin [Arsukibacterium sp. MJ3]|uniref:glutathione S-transferase N-terminal domain-containing protein n=1 Tax=Arsukibacterium sp. MJ3 TaxID=1632859 RepID=UPI0006273A41|nr:glutathione S-transferase N-terminal domain-containing protein [Arsukibacterium sp. MJ3]KKO47774.1 glutaredoxin [Arsukibacterium sp. MJ3]